MFGNMFENTSSLSRTGTTRPSSRARGPLLATALATILTAVLPLAALIDQRGSRSLESYSVSMYETYDVHPDPGLIYGLLYAVAAVAAVVWLLALLVAWSGRRWTATAVITATVLTALQATTLLSVSEYGQRIFPAQWGLLAAIPPLAGIAAAALALGRRRSPRDETG